MLSLISRRLASAAAALLGISVVIFLLLSVLPGDPVASVLPPTASAADRAQYRAFMGLDHPLGVQYLHWLGNLVHGNLGHSYVLEESVAPVVLSALRATGLLTIGVLLVATSIGVTLGTVAAFHRGRWPERLIQGLTLGGMSLPDFWMAQLLMIGFAATLRWLPASGMHQPQGGGMLDLLTHMIMPVAALSFVPTGIIARATRSSVREALGEDWVDLIRAKRMPRRTLVRHVLRNSTPAIIAIVGLQVGYQLSGAILVETIFAWPGIGQLLAQSIENRDTPVAQTCILVIAVTFVVVNLAADLAIITISPQLRRKAFL